MDYPHWLLQLAMDDPDELSQRLTGQKQAIYSLYSSLLNHASNRSDSELDEEYANDLRVRMKDELKRWVSTKVYTSYRCQDQLFDELVERLSKSTTDALFAQMPYDLPDMLPVRPTTSSVIDDSGRHELSQEFMNESDRISSIADGSVTFDTSVRSTFNWSQLEFDGLKWLDDALGGTVEMSEDLSNIHYADAGECDEIDDQLVQRMSSESQTLERSFKTIDKLDKQIDDQLMVELLSLDQDTTICENLSNLEVMLRTQPNLLLADDPFFGDPLNFEIYLDPSQTDATLGSSASSIDDPSSELERILQPDSGIQVDISRLGVPEALALTNSIEDFINNGNRCVFETPEKRFWIPDDGTATGDSNGAAAHQVIRPNGGGGTERASTPTTCDENKENKKVHSSGETRPKRGSGGPLQNVQPMSVTEQDVPRSQTTRSAKKRKMQLEKPTDPQPKVLRTDESKPIGPQPDESPKDRRPKALQSKDRGLTRRSSSKSSSKPASKPASKSASKLASKPASRPSSRSARKSRNRKKSTFPFQLFDLISRSNSDAIKWMPEGHSFQINFELFEREYLAKNALDATETRSFRCTLSSFGFRKLRGAAPDVYWHPCFKRDDRALLADLRTGLAPK